MERRTEIQVSTVSVSLPLKNRKKASIEEQDCLQGLPLDGKICYIYNKTLHYV